MSNQKDIKNKSYNSDVNTVLLKKKKVLQDYYNLAFDYHFGAVTLWKDIVPSDHLFSPAVFLLRHSIELLLKSLIINEAVSDSYFDSSHSIVLTQGGKNRRIDSIHTLMPLWEAYKDFSLSRRLILEFSDSEADIIENTFSYWDKIDEHSTYYRYPYSKDGCSNKVEPLDIELADVSPEIGRRSTVIISNGSDVRYIKKGEKYLSKVTELFDAAELLFSKVETLIN